MGNYAAASFEELRDLLQTRGYHKTPLSVNGLSDKSQHVLLQVLRTLVNERDEEADVRERLLARNQELERAMERTQRSTRQSSGKSTSAETKLHAVQTQLTQAQQALSAEQAAHRTTREQLQRSRKQTQQVKASTVQYRTVLDRRSERLRERMAAISMSNVKALVPDIRIASPAFVTGAGTPQPTLAEQRLAEVEKHQVALMDTSRALKQLALDALTSLHQADVRLAKIIEVEARPSESGGRRSRSRAEPAMALLQLFPPLRPLVTDDTEDTHPARSQLSTLSRSLQEHVAELAMHTAVNHVSKEYTTPLDASKHELPPSAPPLAKRRHTEPTDE